MSVRPGTGAVLAASAVLLLSGCVRTRVAAIEAALVEGPGPEASLTMDGAPYRLTQCVSGDREYFLGVDLADDGGTIALRLLVDPMDGPQLRLTRATAGAPEATRYTSQSCSRLDARVEPTGWRVNHVRDFEGSLDAECAAATAPRLEAHVRFRHCH